MDILSAIKILKPLADGVNPETRETLPKDSVYHSPNVIRALFHAIKALELVKTRKRSEKSSPKNAGKPWNSQEDNMLIQEFEGNLQIRKIAQNHERTTVAIAARLVRLGKIQERADVLQKIPL